MDTRQIEYILAIAEEKNLSRAAERLFITQSALSQQLAKLKKEGLPPLFIRQKQELQLTDAGKIYVHGARMILKLEKDAADALNSLSSNKIRTFHVAVAPYLRPLFYLQALPRLRQMFPNTDVRVHLLASGQLRQALESGEIDLAFYPSFHRSSELLRYQILRQEELVIVQAPGTQTEDLPLVLPEPGTHLRVICDHALGANEFRSRIYAETNHTDLALALAATGDCAAILPRKYAAAQDLKVFSFPDPCYYYLIAAQRKSSLFPPIDHAIKIMEELIN